MRPSLRPLLRAAFAITATAALPIAYSCTIVNGLSLPPKDAGPDARDAGDSGPDAFDGCNHVRVPPRPPPDSDPTDLDILIAVRAAHVDDGIIGVDLDNACTCAPHDPTCASQTAGCDGDGGIDDQAGLLLTTLALAAPFEQQMNDTIIGGGRGSLLVHVQKYNGRLDDPDVKISFYSSKGPGTLQADGGISQHPPDFSGVDTWTVDRSRLTSGQPPGTYDSSTEAYVANGILVAPFTALGRISETIESALTGARLTAPIDFTEPGKPRIHGGLLAGRWPTDKLLAMMQGTICSVPQILIRDTVCSAADIMSEESQDKKGLPCNALSIALRFEAVPAAFGPPIAFGPTNTPCLDDGGSILLCTQ